ELDHLAEERVRHLDQQSRAVTGILLSTRSAAMLQVAQRGQAVVDDVVARLAGERGDECDATFVVLEPGVVQTLLAGTRVQSVMAHRHSRRRGGGRGRRWPCGVFVRLPYIVAIQLKPAPTSEPMP